MKTISRNLLSISLISSVLILMSVSPVMGVVRQTEDLKTSVATCTRISILQSASEAAIAVKITAMQNNFAARLAKITSDETAVDQKVTAARTDAQNRFAEKITAMDSKTSLTWNELSVIETYKKNMQAAKTTRETTVDKARNEYRTALSALITKHQQDLTDTATAYNASIKSAFATANINCTDGNSGTMSTLKSSVKTARQTLTTSRKSDKITTEIKQLATTRNEAIKAANAAFAKAAAEHTKTLTNALESTTQP